MSVRRSRSETLYLAAYTLWLTAAVLGITQWYEYEAAAWFYNYGRKLAYLLLACSFLIKEKHGRKDVAALLVLVFTAVLDQRSVYNRQAFYMAAFLCCSGDIRPGKLLRCTLAVHAAVMLITVAASLTGVIEDVLWYNMGRTRHSLGYAYCGYPAHIFLFLTLIWFCLRKKITVPEAVCFLAVNYMIYSFTGSRTDFILSVLAVAGFFIWPRDFRSIWIRRVRAWFTAFSYPVLCVLSIAAHLLYRPESGWMSKLNYILNNRLQYGCDAIETYGFSLFGRRILWVGQGLLKANPDSVYNYVDCSYLKEALSYGIVFVILLGVGFFLAGKWMERHRAYALSWAVMVMLLYSVINAQLCVLTFNVFTLLAGKAFAQEDAAEKETVLRRQTLSWPAQLRKGAGSLADALGSFAPGASGRYRIAVMLALLVIPLYFQSRSTGYGIYWNGVGRWLICGLLLLLSVFCPQQKGTGAAKEERLRRLLTVFTLAYLALASVSDLVTGRQYSGAPVCMLLYGGLFCLCLRRMEHPERLLSEYAFVYRVSFWPVLLFCLLFRPASPGIHYSGILADAASFGFYLLLVFAAFLDGLDRGSHVFFQSMGAVCSLYLIWTTQKAVPVLLAGCLAALSAAYWLKTRSSFLWKHALSGHRRSRLSGRRSVQTCSGLLAGLLLVLLIRRLLYTLPSALGTELVYAADRPEQITETVLQAAASWQRLLLEKWQESLVWIGQLNVYGHGSLNLEDGQWVQPASSLLTVAWRYGLPAGFAWSGMMLACLVCAVRAAFQKGTFFVYGLAFVCVFGNVWGAAEQPFAHPLWVSLYFGICWMISSDGETKKHEVSEYKGGQPDL